MIALRPADPGTTPGQGSVKRHNTVGRPSVQGPGRLMILSPVSSQHARHLVKTRQNIAQTLSIDVFKQLKNKESDIFWLFNGKKVRQSKPEQHFTAKQACGFPPLLLSELRLGSCKLNWVVADATPAFACSFWNRLGLPTPCKSSKSMLPDAEIRRGCRSPHLILRFHEDTRREQQGH